MQPKKQLKVQYISIFEEIDSFYWPKMHFLKVGQKIRACPKENVFFFIEAFPKRGPCFCSSLTHLVTPYILTTGTGPEDAPGIPDTGRPM